MIHSIGVISKADENGNFMEDVTINSVTPEEWGLPWEEREEALRNANISKPNASVITINWRWGIVCVADVMEKKFVL